MSKKKIIIILSILVIVVAIISLYGTFATNSTVNTSDSQTYNVTLTNSTSEVTMPASSSKTIYYKLSNTNKGTVKYGVAYSGTNITVKIYSDSNDPETGLINYGENKFIKLYIQNTSTTDSTATITTILGYENGGDLIVPTGKTLVTEMYSKEVHNVQVSAVEYITNLYTNATKTTVENNSITYNYATNLSLMNDRLGGTTETLDGGNIRYYGANPNNYIYFNCEEYPDTNCELWRIIGVFDDKIKIIRNESIGNYSWDTAAKAASLILSKPGVNEWSQADAMKLLNPGYESESVGGSLYYNSGSGTCYNGTKNATTSCDFTNTGIKNDTTRSKIAEATWNTGGSSGTNTADGYSNSLYILERGIETVSNPSDNVVRTTTWNGKIALAYPSDYGYATDFNKCSQNLQNYDSSTDSYACRTNDWMHSILGTSSNGWLLTPSSSLAHCALYVKSDGGTIYSNSQGPIYQPFNVVPSLFLNSTEIIVDGTEGTPNNPYKLMP